MASAAVRRRLSFSVCFFVWFPQNKIAMCLESFCLNMIPKRFSYSVRGCFFFKELNDNRSSGSGSSPGIVLITLITLTREHT